MAKQQQLRGVDEPYDYRASDAEKSARRQRRFKQRRLDAGLKRVAVWVPQGCEQELREYAARLVASVPGERRDG